MQLKRYKIIGIPYIMVKLKNIKYTCGENHCISMNLDAYTLYNRKENTKSNGYNIASFCDLVHYATSNYSLTLSMFSLILHYLYLFWEP